KMFEVGVGAFESFIGLPKRFLLPDAGRYIASYFGRTSNPPIAIFHRRNGEGDVQPRAVFTHANRFKMVDALATSQACQNIRFLVEAIGRNDKRDGLANSLRRSIAEQSFGGFVPAHDN